MHLILLVLATCCTLTYIMQSGAPFNVVSSQSKKNPARADVMAALKPCCLSLPFSCNTQWRHTKSFYNLTNRSLLPVLVRFLSSGWADVKNTPLGHTFGLPGSFFFILFFFTIYCIYVICTANLKETLGDFCGAYLKWRHIDCLLLLMS